MIIIVIIVIISLFVTRGNANVKITLTDQNKKKKKNEQKKIKSNPVMANCKKNNKYKLFYNFIFEARLVIFIIFRSQKAQS